MDKTILPQAATVEASRLISLRKIAATLPPLPHLATGGPGSNPVRAKGSGLDIHDVRPFTIGDDFRHVDARVTARSGKLHVRNYHDEQDRVAFLVADFRRSMLWGTRRRLRSVAGAQVLALNGWRMIHAGGRVGTFVMMDEGSVYEPPRRNDIAMTRGAAALADAHSKALKNVPDYQTMMKASSARVELDVWLDQISHLIPRGATLILASALDDLGDNFSKSLRALVRHVHVEIIIIRDVFERSPPKQSLPFFSSSTSMRWGRFSKIKEKSTEQMKMLSELGANIQIVDTDFEVEDIYAHAR